MEKVDFLVIGGGVVGLAVARALRRRHRRAAVALLEKERQCGAHASGRNSGVLHAGFYYTADSLKARLTADGNRRLKEYCRSRGIPVRESGKLVVARDAQEDAVLDELLRRALCNGVELREVTLKEARAIEPRVKTWERALFSPGTASVDPRQVVAHLARDAADEGVTVRYATGYRHWDGRLVHTSAGPIEAGFVVNAAGLYADRVARDFGFSRHYRVLPFKGLYLYSREPVGRLRTHIYPVPDLRNPFLGVHFTLRADGRVKIGPTAIPVLWREQYHGLHGFRLGEMLEIAYRAGGLLADSHFGFRQLAWEEMQKYSRRRLVALAATLADGVRPQDYRQWGEPGIRAQLVDIIQRRLVMDFVLEGDDRSLHILNAVSPGFTCCLSFAEYVVDTMEGHTAAGMAAARPAVNA